MKRSPSFSLAEVLIALGIIGFALIPILTMSGSTARQAAFSEYHIFFQTRAVRLLEHFSIYRYSALVQLAGADGRIAVTLEDPPIPAEFRRKLKRCKETLTFHELQPGIGRLTAKMEWAFPSDKKGASQDARHSFLLTRLVADPTHSLRVREELQL